MPLTAPTSVYHHCVCPCVQGAVAAAEETPVSVHTQTHAHTLSNEYSLFSGITFAHSGAGFGHTPSHDAQALPSSAHARTTLSGDSTIDQALSARYRLSGTGVCMLMHLLTTQYRGHGKLRAYPLRQRGYAGSAELCKHIGAHRGSGATCGNTAAHCRCPDERTRTAGRGAGICGACCDAARTAIKKCSFTDTGTSAGTE
jgi:hypothetical protein